MNEHRERRSPHLGLLLLIPAAVLIAKGASRRRATSEWGSDGAASFGPRHGHHGYFRAGDRPDENAAVGMPRMIERMLEAWHTKAHEQGEAAEPTAS